MRTISQFIVNTFELLDQTYTDIEVYEVFTHLKDGVEFDEVQAQECAWGDSYSNRRGGRGGTPPGTAMGKTVR